jgi:hypothetical protein
MGTMGTKICLFNALVFEPALRVRSIPYFALLFFKEYP